ncbi:39S ribosomal protein L21 isoform 1 [Schistosoma japonicum]|uniref:Large ribosomal subunit protein bL21m n=2 Tax=Schistosoma japonicum TaxID=6182 RepID=A0A4Z2DHY6_SCHJA|nr:50S ribosomal protein L21, mitochondrial [Schistosoma japonicum]TNN16048.1 39S ribosomal protein L21 isoform 1 [Schistosoma japonicum]
MLFTGLSLRWNYHLVCGRLNLTTSSFLLDWIRKITPRKPTRFKLHKAYTVLEKELLELSQPESLSLPQCNTLLHQSIYDAVNSSISEKSSQYFAVVNIAGKQFKVTNNDLIMVKTPLYGTDVGDRVQLRKVMLLGSSDFTIIGRPILPVHQVFIEAVVIEKTLEHPKVWYQFHRRRRHHKLRVFQDNVTVLRITDIRPNVLET